MKNWPDNADPEQLFQKVLMKPQLENQQRIELEAFLQPTDNLQFLNRA